MEFHPLANLFPLMEGGAFDALVADIKANGIREQLVMFEDMLLDGRNRWRAAEAAGVTITARNTRQFDPKRDGDPLAWVISKNLQRRHLSETQRALVGAKLATLEHGTNQWSGKFAAPTQAEAAGMLNVSERLLRHAVFVRNGRKDGSKAAAPELLDLAERDGITVSLAARAAKKLSGEEQRQLVGQIVESGKPAAASAILRGFTKRKDEARILQLHPSPGKYRSLVIDPPWDYGDLSLAGRAAPEYATMTHEQLLALDVGQWADDDFCHVYLWVTNNFLTRGVELMARWGFAHKTVLTWIKPRIGMGSYFRNSTEHALFGVRGSQSTRRDDIPTHFEAPVGQHSEKPEKFYEIVRAASYPLYGELFQREPRSDFANLYALKAIEDGSAAAGDTAAVA